MEGKSAAACAIWSIGNAWLCMQVRQPAPSTMKMMRLLIVHHEGYCGTWAHDNARLLVDSNFGITLARHYVADIATSGAPKSQSPKQSSHQLGLVILTAGSDVLTVLDIAYVKDSKCSHRNKSSAHSMHMHEHDIHS